MILVFETRADEGGDELRGFVLNDDLAGAEAWVFVMSPA